MDEMTEQNLRVIESDSQETREKEVIEKLQSTRQTNPIARKLLDFSLSNKTRKFSVKDLFTRQVRVARLYEGRYAHKFVRFVRNRNSIYTSSPRGVNTATSVQVVQRLLRVCEAIGELFGRFVVCGVNGF